MATQQRCPRCMNMPNLAAHSTSVTLSVQVILVGCVAGGIALVGVAFMMPCLGRRAEAAAAVTLAAMNGGIGQEGESKSAFEGPDGGGFGGGGFGDGGFGGPAVEVAVGAPPVVAAAGPEGAVGMLDYVAHELNVDPCVSCLAPDSCLNGRGGGADLSAMSAYLVCTGGLLRYDVLKTNATVAKIHQNATRHEVCLSPTLEHCRTAVSPLIDMLPGLSSLVAPPTDRVGGGALESCRARAQVRTEELFKYVQVFTAVVDSFSHGANDVANAMGPYAAIYVTYKNGYVDSEEDVGSDMYWILAREC